MLTFNNGLNNVDQRMIVSKTRNAAGWATKADNLIPNGVKCNENVIWVSVLRLPFYMYELTSIH